MHRYCLQVEPMQLHMISQPVKSLMKHKLTIIYISIQLKWHTVDSALQ